MKKYFRYIFLPLLVVLVIFVGTCLLSSNDVPNMPANIAWDKLAHFGMFFVLSGVSLFFYYKLHNGKPKMSRCIFWGFIVPVIYGGVIELLQKYLFTSRSAEWGDFVANMLGALFGCVVVVVYFRILKNCTSR
jgi:VanZ family protein